MSPSVGNGTDSSRLFAISPFTALALDPGMILAMVADPLPTGCASPVVEIAVTALEVPELYVTLVVRSLVLESE